MLTTDCLMVHSRSQPLVIGFKVASKPSLSLKCLPFPIVIPRVVQRPLTSLITVQLQKRTKRWLYDVHTSLMGISPDGGVHALFFDSTGQGDRTILERPKGWEGVKPVMKVDWDEGVDKIAQEEIQYREEGEGEKKSTVDVDEEGDEKKDVKGTKYKELNFRWAWLGALFQ